LPTYNIKKGIYAGLKNRYYKLYDSKYSKYIGKRNKKLGRKNHFGNIRRKFQETTIKKYIAVFASLGATSPSYSNLIKKNKVELSKSLYALKKK